MLSKQVGKGFVGQFLEGPHSVAGELPQLVERIVVKGDQFTHG